MAKVLTEVLLPALSSNEVQEEMEQARRWSLNTETFKFIEHLLTRSCLKVFMNNMAQLRISDFKRNPQFTIYSVSQKVPPPPTPQKRKLFCNIFV